MYFRRPTNTASDLERVPKFPQFLHFAVHYPHAIYEELFCHLKKSQENYVAAKQKIGHIFQTTFERHVCPVFSFRLCHLEKQKINKEFKIERFSIILIQECRADAINNGAFHKLRSNCYKAHNT